ncbi:MAG TPA: hypothetical protein VFS20_16120, partial [Longimicrobium sp.]|nr:hypothetical protein [Longimicrobium sp.]
DNPPLFWERLRLEHLSAFVSRHPERGLHLTLDVPLTLPVDGRASLENAKRALLWELSQQLTGNRFDIKDGATLAEHLGQQDGTIALLAFPATNPAPALGTAIEALLVLLDEIGTGDVLRRLVVAVTLEDPALSELSLVDEWKLNRFARSMVVELGPLDPISAHHARVWYHRRQIFETFGVEDTRIDALFSATPQMRMLDFDKSVQPLLNPASNQP